MAVDGSITIDTKIDQTGIKKGLKSVNSDVNKSMSTAQKSVTKSLGILKAGIVGLGLTELAEQIRDIGVELIDIASQAEETNAKFRTAFKGIEYTAESVAKSLAENYGLSQLESEKLLSGTGDLIKGFGATAEVALEMSNTVQQMAVDLASYNNLQGGATQASEILTKAFLGERESLTTLGIKISEADVKQRLLEKGQKSLTGQALLLAKGQATLELAMEQSGDAMGGFNRTQDSYANISRKAESATIDLKSAMGVGLLPTASGLKGIYINLATELTNYLNKVNETATALRALEDGSATLVQKKSVLTRKFEEEEAELLRLRDAYKNQTGLEGGMFRNAIIQQELKMKGIRDAISLIDEEIEANEKKRQAEIKAEEAKQQAQQAENKTHGEGIALINDIIDAHKTEAETIQDKIDKIKEYNALTKGEEDDKKKALGLLEEELALLTMISGATLTAGGNIASGQLLDLSTLGDQLGTGKISLSLSQPEVEQASETIDDLTTSFTELDTTTSSSSVGLVIKEILGTISDGVRTATNMIKSFISDFTSTVNYLADFSTASVLQTLSETIDGLNNFFSDAGELYSIANMFQQGVKLIADFVAGIYENREAVFDEIGNILNGVITTISKYKDTFVKQISTIITGFADTIEKNKSIIFAMGKLLAELVNEIMKNAPKLLNAGLSMISSFLSGFTSDTIALTDSITTMINGMLDAIIKHAPTLITSGLNILLSILKGITNNAEKIGQTATTIVSTLITWFGNNISELSKVGLKVVSGIVTGIINNIDDIIDAVIGVIPDLITALVTAIPAIFKAGGKLALAIIGALPSLFSASGEVVLALVEGGIEAGKAFINAIAEGIESAPEAIEDAFESLLTNIADAFEDLGDGIAQIFEALGLGDEFESIKIDVADFAGKIFGFAQGSAYIEEDQLANIHKGERIIPKSFNDSIMSGDTMMLNTEAFSSIMNGLQGGASMPYVNSGSNGSTSINVNVNGIMEVDGRSIGQIAFEYTDEMVGLAYGS